MHTAQVGWMFYDAWPFVQIVGKGSIAASFSFRHTFTPTGQPIRYGDSSSSLSLFQMFP